VPKVSNLSARGTLRLGLTRLVPQLPGFGALLVSLAREPQVTSCKYAGLLGVVSQDCSAACVLSVCTPYGFGALLVSLAREPHVTSVLRTAVQVLGGASRNELCHSAGSPGSKAQVHPRTCFAL
jgi:hypothetical protein